MKLRPLHCIDFYKSGHIFQYPAGTEFIYSNFTARSTRLANMSKGYDNKIVVFGIQYFIKYFLMEEFRDGFFNLPKDKVINDIKRRMDTSLGKDSVTVKHFEELHDLGYLPIEIKALPEGSVIDTNIPLLTIVNTDPKFFWLVNYLETALSAFLWKASTSATIANDFRKLFYKYQIETNSAAEAFYKFQGHDFSCRGMSGMHDAAISGAAHLLSFLGTDTVSAIDLLEDYYGANSDYEMIGTSVPATEHSVMCSGKKESEIDTFKRLITETYPEGFVSIVSDTWDFWKVMTNLLPELKEDIMSRSGKLVIRPDSGDPVKIICGTCYKVNDDFVHSELNLGMLTAKGFWEFEQAGKYYIINVDRAEGYTTYETEPTPAMKGAAQLLWDTFGGTISNEGYKVLDSHIGLIYGDSITISRAEAILEGLKNKGFASTNIVLGIGSFTYQHTTRDTLGFAMKSTNCVINGVSEAIFKDPATDGGVKKSHRGLLRVEKVANDYICYQQQTPEEEKGGLLRRVFHNGVLYNEENLTQIRQRLDSELQFKQEVLDAA